MKLAAADIIERAIAAHPLLDETRKRFLVGYVEDATPERLARTLAAAPAEDASFMRAILQPESAAA